MSPLAIIFLSFGLWLHQWIGAQEATLPRPSLWADPGPLIPQKRSVILRCRGFPGAEKYRLRREGGSPDRDVSTAGTEAEFPISSVTSDTVGHYRCLYMSQSHWSKPSEPVELVMTDWYDKPSLSALPSPEVASGENVTLRCRSNQWFEKYALHKEGGAISQSQGSWYHADFLIPAVKVAHQGSYRCYSLHRESPYEWSAPSDPLELRVTEATDDPQLQNSRNPWNSSNSTSDVPPQDYQVGNLIRFSLAGLVLIMLGLLLAEAWHSERRHREAAQKPLPPLPVQPKKQGGSVNL
ncbi:leukocyte immunoglobulin-like receptor subfamily A member 2 [Monodelphis domestica]|uniref:leukocyte immunoglobulin-like receptor subfamily A member 2 n=1 Tax=Monodelphis domestica TaxID=13616 RepID=UPI0024E1AB1B|nr:leukocyte immunoglobulin-like receptor subfamily A member 2 [Monodelphis domestica]